MSIRVLMSTCNCQTTACECLQRLTTPYVDTTSNFNEPSLVEYNNYYQEYDKMFDDWTIYKCPAWCSAKGRLPDLPPIEYDATRILATSRAMRMYRPEQKPGTYG